MNHTHGSTPIKEGKPNHEYNALFEEKSWNCSLYCDEQHGEETLLIKLPINIKEEEEKKVNEYIDAINLKQFNGALFYDPQFRCIYFEHKYQPENSITTHRLHILENSLSKAYKHLIRIISIAEGIVTPKEAQTWAQWIN